jgi:hypothetical protein
VTRTAAAAGLNATAIIVITPAVANSPGLTVGPAAKTVTAGAAATTLMATLTGSTSAIAWSLSGDGASSATSGTTITVDGWTEEIGGATVTALLVPNSSATGDTTFPVTPAADGSFSVVNVSGGVYFIQVDQPVPDLTLAIYGRADHTSSALRTTLGVNVSGLTPLADPAIESTVSTQLVFTAAQAPIFNLRPQGLLTPRPAPGDTSVSGQLDYSTSHPALHHLDRVRQLRRRAVHSLIKRAWAWPGCRPSARRAARPC